MPGGTCSPSNTESESPRKNTMEAIALIGMAGRFPKAADVRTFWRNLCEGIEGIRFFSAQELIEEGLPPDLVNRPEYVPAKGYLEDAEFFDAAFFGYSPREAQVIDPQQRLLLECAWKALEDAAYVSGSFAGAIAVFTGVSMNTYFTQRLLMNREVLAAVGGYQAMISNDKDYAPTRISYLLNLTGPSIGIQTACSTSLVAVERACQSLVNRECDMALAGGASLSFPRRAGYLFQDGMILSPDGHCRVFDARARGTVGGEGVGIVVLKRLSDARADGDSIYAVIRGWAINNDGSAKVGYTAPGVGGQAAVIAAAQALAGVDPRSVTYVEAHGTGTQLGDPVEIAALSQVFHARQADRGYCRIGSLKSNIGHLDAAAGIASLIKTALALKFRKIPPSLHFQEPNPQIDFESSPFCVNDQLTDWTASRFPRRAGVSSFGIGGTNAHLVLEEAPPEERSGPSRPDQLLMLSAKTDSALETATSNLAAWLKERPEAELADVAYTLHVGRKVFPYRRFLVCSDREDALQALQDGPGPRLLTACDSTVDRGVAFLFPGQGTQYVQMGRGLYESEPCFRQHLDACAELLRPALGLDLREILYPAAETASEAASPLVGTALAQPALFAVEYALAKQWEAWGVRPAAMIGHSVGEYVAACLAGVFSWEEALWLVAKRGELMQSAEPGAMLAVPLAESEVRELLRDGLALAACNAPENSVVSGTPEAVARLEAFLTQQGFATRRLHTSHAFHSPLMAAASRQFQALVEQVGRRPPQIPFVSNVTGRWITDSQAVDPAYWAEHLQQTVRFAEGMELLLQQTGTSLLEVGPGRALATLARQIAQRRATPLVFSSLRHPQEAKSDQAVLLQTLGRLWLAGTAVSWHGFYAHQRRRRLSLPSYPFERKRYCVDAPQTPAAARLLDAPARLPAADWFYRPSWKQFAPLLSAAAFPKAPQEPRCWLLLLDGCGVGAALQERLAAAGQHVVTVQPGNTFSRTGADSFTVHPKRFGDYVALFDELRRRPEMPSRIMHLWNVSRTPPASFDDAQEMGFYSLLYLAQVLGRQPAGQWIQWDIISSGLQEVTGHERLMPEKATLRGPLLVIPQEYPHIVCRSIDVELPLDGSLPTSALIDQLEQECLREVTCTELALRGRYGWVRTYERMHVPAVDKVSPRLRDSGVYWILGGLGRIGLELASVLARSVRAKLVLTGRRPLPPRDQWEAWCDQHDPDELDVQRIRKIREIESWGAEVLVQAADMADEMQMRDALQAIEARFGKVQGVIHSAGTVEGRIIHYLTPDHCEAQFLAKVRGLYVLKQLVRGQPLDFCLITSSLSSVLGGMGFCAYTAANAYLDAFAASENRRGGCPWFNINWDGWKFGPAADESGADAPVNWLLSSAEGADAFRRLLAADWPDRVVVSSVDFPARVRQWVDRAVPAAVETPQPQPPPTVHPRPANLSTAFAPPRNDLERTVAEVWQELLGIEEIGIHDDYIELGGHSLLAGRLIARLREILQVPLAIRNLFESPTVARLAAHVETHRWAAQSSSTAAPAAGDEERDEFEV